mgnify:CR=1 FL=1
MRFIEIGGALIHSAAVRKISFDRENLTVQVEYANGDQDARKVKEASHLTQIEQEFCDLGHPIRRA